MNVLLTGGAGFIGSHTAVELIEKGHGVIIVDNLVNSKPESVRRVEAITGTKVKLYVDDVADKAALEKIFEENKIDAVIHFAGLKAVGESVQLPVLYYRNNLDTTLTLLETMKKHGCNKLIFSSSATVYGDPETVPITENMHVGNCSNPYGKTKYMIEEILKDTCHADKNLSVVLLRYFNPIGAHKSGLLVEDPNGIPNNLMPYILKVAMGKMPHLNVFGDDYPTPDGTGVRDYIHVTDLAKGHVSAIEYADVHSGVEVFNLGTGNGYSVLDVVKAFEKASGNPLPYKIAPRREGDIAACYASPDKAYNGLKWKAELTIDDMCRDAWEAVKKNPEGYPND